MSAHKKEPDLILKPSYPRNVSIDEDIHTTLTIHAFSLYVVFRYQADFKSDDSEIQRSAEFLYTKAKISRSQYYRCLNELESHGLILRDPDNKLGEKCIFHIARELNYFTRGVSHRDRGVSHRDTDQFCSNINITTSVNSEKLKKQDELLEEMKEAYHKVFPELVYFKKLDTKLKTQLKKLIKNWPDYQKDGNKFTIESFVDYLNVVRTNNPWVIKKYETKGGNFRKNSLRTITTETFIIKIINREFNDN